MPTVSVSIVIWTLWFLLPFLLVSVEHRLEMPLKRIVHHESQLEARRLRHSRVAVVVAISTAFDAPFVVKGKASHRNSVYYCRIVYGIPVEIVVCRYGYNVREARDNVDLKQSKDVTIKGFLFQDNESEHRNAVDEIREGF